MAKTVVTARSKLLKNQYLILDGLGNTHDNSSVNVLAQWNDSVTYGDNIPGWRDRLRSGLNVTTELDATRRRISFVPGMARLTRKSSNPDQFSEYRMTGLSNYCVNFVWPSDPSALLEEKAANRALSVFNQKAHQVNTSFEGGVFLGELAETIHGIRHPAQAFRKAVTAYRGEAKKLRREILLASPSFRSGVNLRLLSMRELGRVQAREATKALAGLWLERSFHWNPLIADIKDGIKTFVDRGKVNPFQQRISAVGFDESSSQFSAVDGIAPGWSGPGSTHVVDKSSVRVLFRGAIRVVQHEIDSGVLESVGLTLPNFIPTLYELMPYSWLLDYFSNLGAIIQAASQGGLNVAWSNKTVHRTNSRTLQLQSLFSQSEYDSLWNKQLFGSKLELERTTIKRSSYDGNYMPSFEFKLPGFGSKWLNLGALGAARIVDQIL